MDRRIALADVHEIVAHKPGYRGRPPKRAATGRVCMAEGCDTKLSMYNRKETCFRHSPTRYPRTRGRAVRDDTTPPLDANEA